MGQQMGKEAELPLICSENSEFGHTQREKRRERKMLGKTDRGRQEPVCTLLLFLNHVVKISPTFF